MSEWKQQAARRRDARNGGPAPTVKVRPKKDRKRWCRGKDGVEHKPLAKTYDEVKGTKTLPSGTIFNHAGWWILVCTECGKELENYWPSKWWKVRRPDWVPPPQSGGEGNV